MVYNLTYRRPSFRPRSQESVSGEEKQRSIQESVNSASSSSGSSHGIPEALSFDRIIAGGVCPPCTVRDFMNYLKYIEHAAENLQFFLWYKDYVRRFNDLPESERSLAPEWTVEQAEAEALAAQTQSQGRVKVNPAATVIFDGTDFESKAGNDAEKVNPFYTPPRTPSTESKRVDDAKSSGDQSTYTSAKSTIQKKAEGAFEDAGLKWQPFSVQPYRKEIERIITVYIAEGSPRELNLSSKERTSLLHALENTTHPSAFHSVLTSIEWSLRCQSHPNFIRWAICNGNRPRVIFARGLGVSTILLGLVAAILLTLSGASRAWRVLSIIGFLVGTATLIAAWKGMCVVLHGMHHRHLRPWELFSDADDASEEIIDPKKSADYSKDSFSSSNSFEDEPWVARYEKRNVVRKVFDREVWIEEPALRQIQDTIFLQAMLGAFVVSAVSVGIFCALPAGNFY